jgi:hypothetical protein
MTNGESLAKMNRRTIFALIVFLLLSTSFHSTSCNSFIFGIQTSQRSPKMPSKTILFLNKGSAITLSSFLQLPNDSPANQRPVPHDGPAHFKQLSVLKTIAFIGLQAYNNYHFILNGVTETSIWHQAFENTLSCRLIMKVSNKTSVPALNALLTSRYLHPAGAMMAHTDATPTSLLLFHIKDGTVIMSSIHDPSLLLPFYHIGSAITTALRAPSLLLLYVLIDPAIMIATRTNLLLPYVWDDPAIMTTTHAKLILTLQLIVVFTQGVLTAEHNYHGTLSNSEGVCASIRNFNDTKISLHFCKDCGIFCKGEWEVKGNDNAIIKQQSVYISVLSKEQSKDWKTMSGASSVSWSSTLEGTLCL